jgi:hypothetical protein
MKTVFQIDRAGMLVGPTEADESPLEPGVYLIPAGCVEAPPPAQWPEDKWPRWNGAKWRLVNRPQPVAEQADPVAKLRDFLAANPDVAAILEQGSV